MAWVPESSPRDTNDACVAAIFSKCRGAVQRLDPGGVVAGPDEHEVVVHHQPPPPGRALGDEVLLGGRGVHEQDVGLAAPAELDGLAAADRERS